MASEMRLAQRRAPKSARARLAAWLVCALAATPVVAPSESAAQAGASPVVSVGVLPFQDDSGSEVSAELRQRLARDVQRRLNAAHADLLARLLDASSGTSAEELAALGRQGGVAFVVRGGLVGLSSEAAGAEARAEVQLYADVLAVESGRLSTVRASGTATGADAVDPASVDPQSGEFAASALGQAWAVAVEQLARSIHDEAVAPAPPEPAAGAEAETAAASNEELQQLIGQASALLAGGGSLDPATLQALSSALEALNNALATQAGLLEQGQPTATADQEVALRTQALRSAVAAATEQVASQSGVPPATGAEQQSLLAAAGQSLGEAVDVLAKIQEIRSMLRGAEESEASAGEASGTGGSAEPQAEEPLGEVSGVVTESGEPVEGVTVTDPESGATATTNESGSYSLVGLIPGRLTKLVLSKKSKSLAVSQIDVVRGRPSLADFELKPGVFADARPTLGVRPSIVVLRPAKRGAAGRVRGVVRDAQGHPVPRALVSLPGVAAVARTDSQGRYEFINVPPGSQRLLVQQLGMQPEIRTLQVSARGTSASDVQIAPDTRARSVPTAPRLVVRGSGAGLRGTVKGSGNRPLGGAKVTAVRSPRAVSTFTDSAGRYALKDIQPGSYRVVVSKLAYESVTCVQVVRPGKQETRDFELEASRSALAGKLSGRVPTAPRPAATPKPTRTSAPPARGTRPPPVLIRPAPGVLQGRVADAKTGRPVSGAAVALAGVGAVTGSSGRFALGNLAPGTYQLSVRRNGYRDETVGVTVRAGQTTRVDIRLAPLAVKRIAPR